MPNMLDYIRWRGDIPLSSSPFNEIDNIIFSMLSFIDYSGIITESASSSPVRLSDCLDYHREKYPSGQDFGAIIPKDNNALLSLAAGSKRFEDTYVLAYRDEIDENEVKQFAAVTFILPDNSVYVAFRGTDDTFVGWKEDLAMSYGFPTASQRASVEYLSQIAENHRGKIRLGGHSKGGNLAAYAAVFSPETIRDRIITAYNNDGPGFMKDIISSPEYLAGKDKIYTIVPQSSLVGMLFETTENLHVIESTAHGGANQHTPYSWVVLGAAFNHLDSITDEGRRNDSVFDQWIAGSTPEEREKFTDTVFSVLEAAGSKTLTDFGANKLRNVTAIMKAIAGFDKATRDNALMFVKRLIEAIWG